MNNSRNLVKIDTIEGKHILNKVLIGEENDVERRTLNLKKWDEFIKSHDLVKSPEIKSIDSNNIYYQFIDNATTLEDMIENKKPESMASYLIRAARILSKINSIEINYDNFNQSVLANVELLYALSQKQYVNCSGAELQLYSLLQNDTDLISKLDSYRKKINKNVLGFCHGDIRLDQFLVDSQDNIWTIDFEECGVNDTMSDLGSLIGSIFFHALYSSFSVEIKEAPNEEKINEGFMKKGQEKLQMYRDIIRKMINEYESRRTIDYTDLAVQVGWFLIERIVSRASFSTRLSELDKAIAGIGRNLVIYPSIMLDYLEMEE